jgi:uncharacterized membrane protein YkoI
MKSSAKNLAASLALALVAALPAWAGGEYDQDQARRALEAGEILPLRAILARVESDAPGQIMEIELERKNARWVYEVKVLRADGSLVKLKIDAHDGTLLGTKEHGAKGVQ